MSSKDTIKYAERKSIFQVEEQLELAPKFNEDGLLPVVTTCSKTSEVLMVGYMNEEALSLSILSGEAHYWSRSRRSIWHKGATSGLTQRIIQIRIDDDQDSLWLSVDVQGSGASCHVGYRSCFYRSIDLKNGEVSLKFEEKEKVFDPEIVYKGKENPTKL
ncbi:phosphoribosyl-AMP cyclohydrolase [Hyphomicrobiales bacterium]|jgi:phosphoribosyl-AMP cyclohydrolase|nr:phosphoribosyl-AMP cyclohydrolase [Rhodobiaceae bacterium]MBT6223476.1 phosphoribosyl-AMP cyclohydrolase [Rhodobiaceae bacterium]MDB4831755.1 phosphoribosyl-AMP cyclohydrolase [Hyphomicrobiales bacterium]MDC0139297.1 phosphoribosyl-AMP cyclohydrolase [Hyphomicrobiales bacterium]MDC3272889.1 phosphoribosyl-AMP cyclohydrolase [Hyphomicrobiales bacterium]|tara:strand:- start:422 stop:901 length:480 start_codon:yes stop_codon:yes gene_type:complete